MAKVKDHVLKVLAWNHRKYGFPVFVLVVLALWTQLSLVDSPVGRRFLEKLSSERSEQTILSSDRFDISHPPSASSAPLATWIDFDDDSVQNIRKRAAGRSALTKVHPNVSVRIELAQVLKWIRQGPRPRLVFLDLSPLYEAPAAETQTLVNELAIWNDDPKAAPLAIFAGSACNERYEGQASTLLDDKRYDRIAIPTTSGSYPPGNRIVWACPMYHDTNAFFWSCAYADDGGDATATVALPSPGWFAIAARNNPSGDIAKWMIPGLAAASRACRAQETSVLLPNESDEVAKLNHIRLSFNPLKLDKIRLNGEPVVQRVPAKEVLDNPSYSARIIKDRLVVIGASDVSRGSIDLVPTSLGPISGSLMVISEIRASWTQGLPRRTNWWTSGLIATAFALGAYGLLLLARWTRGGKGRRSQSLILRVVTNSHVIAVIYIPLCIWFAIGVDRTLLGLDFIKIALSVITVETLFILYSVTEELGEGDRAASRGHIVADRAVESGTSG